MIEKIGQSDLVYTQDGGLAIEWPAGTLAGHTALVVAATSGGGKPATRLPAGWKLLIVNSSKEAIYGKLSLTADDIASPLPINAVISGLVVLSGVIAFGRRSASKGVTIANHQDAVLVFGRRTGSSTAITPPTDRLFATDAVNDRFRKSGKKIVKRRYNAWLRSTYTQGYVAVEGSNTDSMLAVGLVGEVSPADDPRAMTPVGLTPANDSVVKQTTNQRFVWSLPTAFTSRQWRLRQVQLRKVGAAKWGSISNGVWFPSNSKLTEPASASGYQGKTFLVDQLPLGEYEWRVKLRYGSEIWSEWSSPNQFTVAVPPVVGPVTIEADLQPTISWSVASGDQAYFEAQILDSPTNIIYTSGLVDDPSATSWDATGIPWVNGQTCYGKVFITSEAGMRSLGVSSPVVAISWTLPPAPTSAEFVQGSPLVLTVGGLDLAVHERIRVEWGVHGVTHTAYADAADGQIELPLAPFGSVWFFVSASKIQDGIELWSDPLTVSGTNYDQACYLVGEGLEAGDWIRVWPIDDPSMTEQVGITTGAPLGGDSVFVLESDSAGDVGTMVVGTATQAEKMALREWLRNSPRWWFRRAPERKVLGSKTWADVPPMLCARTAGWAEARFNPVSVQQRSVTISWVEQR